MRSMMLAGTVALIGLAAAGCAQPGYGPGNGYGTQTAYGYGAQPAYGYNAQPAYGYNAQRPYGAQPSYYNNSQPSYYNSQPANPVTQMLGGLLTPSSGYGNQGYGGWR